MLNDVVVQDTQFVVLGTHLLLLCSHSVHSVLLAAELVLLLTEFVRLDTTLALLGTHSLLVCSNSVLRAAELALLLEYCVATVDTQIKYIHNIVACY